MLRTSPFVSLRLEFPAGGDPGESVWSQMHTQYSSSRPLYQSNVQEIYENGFPAVRNSTEMVTISAWRSLLDSFVQMTRSLSNYFSDCYRRLCSCRNTDTAPNDNNINGTNATKATICTSGTSGPLRTVDRFAGASAPPRPDMERSVNSNSDSPPYMPSSSRCTNGNGGNPQFGTDLIQSIGFYSSTDGHQRFHSSDETGMLGRYSSQRHKIIRDLPV